MWVLLVPGKESRHKGRRSIDFHYLDREEINLHTKNKSVTRKQVFSEKEWACISKLGVTNINDESIEIFVELRLFYSL